MRRRGQNFRILRLAASSLAVVGLLGHGLAMLLVSLLAQPPAASVAAQQDFPAFVEICTADGLRKVARADLPGGKDETPAAPRHGKINGCPVCTAFAQNGPADLPAAVVPPRHGLRRAAAPRPLHQAATAAPERLRALSRGPPAAA
jgi:hypothetical protein